MRIYIGVGSNIRADSNIIRAIRQLGRYIKLIAVSTFYETVPEKGRRQTNYINGVIAAETEHGPRKLRRIFRRIERKLGRQRSADSYASRPLDLDLILYGRMVIKTKKLDIPDKHIADRGYLCLPLKELAPDLILPDSGLPIAELAPKIETHTMRPLAGITAEIRRYLTS
jgi:2-amino-4-hydroxy-6-hydroxymethyldihydropteridine diphosphokinase